MKGRIERHRLDEIKVVGCVWVGCQETYPIARGKSANDCLPEGWRLLVVVEGSLFDPKNLLNADVDSSLCPKHYRELLSLLKIGGLIEGIG